MVPVTGVRIQEVSSTAHHIAYVRLFEVLWEKEEENSL